tara:strand:+ start:4825 stop:5967 length:1143 start_codon:yes stop_codon:yes gene_type:complete
VAQTGFPISIGNSYSLYSDVLNEDRPYFVSLPASYHDQTIVPKEYPVIYILDGDIYFQSMSGMAQFMGSGINGNYQIPEFIVVGVPNTNRIRDLTPTELTDLPPGPLPDGLSETGGGDEFLRFLNEELFSKIESEYRTMPYRVLAGHSIGGLLGLYALIAHDSMFNAYIIMDPSLWWERKMLLDMARDHFPDSRTPTSSVYISSARLISDGNSPSMAEDAEQFSEILEETSESHNIRFRWDYMESEDHGSIPLISFYNGLNFIFSGYKPVHTEIVNDPDEVVRTYEELSESLGATFLPPESVLIQSALLALNQFGDQEKAIEILELTIGLYPGSFGALNSLGTIHLNAGNTEAAVGYFNRSLEQRPGNSVALSQLEKISE